MSSSDVFNTALTKLRYLRKLEPPYVGSHEKRGQDKILPQRKPKVVLTFDLAGQPSEQLLRCVCDYRSLDFSMGFGSRIHSTSAFR